MAQLALLTAALTTLALIVTANAVLAPPRVSGAAVTLR